MAALRIEPVVEVLGDAEFDLWPVVGRDGSWYQVLHGDLTEREVGTAVHQVLRWFYDDDQGSPAQTIEDYLGRALAPHGPGDAQLMASGGVRFTDTVTGATILPGCCYMVDERSEILDVVDGRRPGCWLGHDPDGGMTLREGVVEITQASEGRRPTLLRFPADEVRAAFDRSESDLDRFCDLVLTWATTHTPGQAHTLTNAVARALGASSHQSGERSAAGGGDGDGREGGTVGTGAAYQEWWSQGDSNP